jgi:hypothetical protein
LIGGRYLLVPDRLMPKLENGVTPSLAVPPNRRLRGYETDVTNFIFDLLSVRWFVVCGI